MKVVKNIWGYFTNVIKIFIDKAHHFLNIYLSASLEMLSNSESTAIFYPPEIY